MTLYIRSTCSLCEAMEDELITYIGRYKLTVHRVYIDNEPALESRYGNRVPVLTHNGQDICQYYLDRDHLLQVIESENQV